MTQSDIRRQLDGLLREYQSLKDQRDREKGALTGAKEQLADALEARTVVQTVAADVQQRVHDHIATLVTRCLRAVFPDPYEFKIHFESKRGKTEARLVFERNGNEHDPQRSVGGGVLDVASFALVVSRLLLTRPPVRRFLALDEPFRHVSANYLPKVRELVEALAEELEIQFLIISHERELADGYVIEF